MFTHKSLALDLVKYDFNEECVFALFEKTSDTLVQLIPYYYYADGYFYKNKYINKALEDNLLISETLKNESMMMEITTYVRENIHKTVIKNFVELHGINIKEKQHFNRKHVKKNEYGIVSYG